MKHKITKILITIGIALFLSFGIASAVSYLMPYQGGTGFASTTPANVGNCIKVLDDSPFTYELGTCGTGGGGATTTINGLSGPDFIFTPLFSGSSFTISTSTATSVVFTIPKNLSAFTNDVPFATSGISGGTALYFPYYTSSTALSATSSLYYGASNRLFVLSPVDGSEVARFDPADAFQLGTTIPLKFSKDGSVSSPSLTWTTNVGGGTGIYKPATSNIGLSTDGVERIRILSTGLVGIGTSTPATKLDVYGTSTFRYPILTDTIYNLLGTAPYIDIANVIIYDENGLSSVDWGSRTLLNSFGNIVFDWENASIDDTSGVQSIDLSSRAMKDSSDALSIIWEDRTLNDTAENPALDWNTSSTIKFPAYITDGILSVTNSDGTIAVTDCATITGSADLCDGDDAVGAGGATTTINGASGPTFTFTASSSGSDFNIATGTSQVIFNIPTASASVRGLLAALDWNTFNQKVASTTQIIPGTGIWGGGALTGDVTISLPQTINTTSTPTFAGLISTGNATSTSLNTGQGQYELYAMNQNVQTTDVVTFGSLISSGNVTSTSLNTGQGQYELYKMDQNVDTTANVTFASLISTGNATSSTLNTGQGQNELYDMNQNVQTTDEVTFAKASTTNQYISGQVSFDTTPDSDHTANGFIDNTINAGATTTAMQIVYYSSSATWLQTDADASTTASGMLGIALEAKNTGEAVKVALSNSFVRDDTWSFATGTPIYISTDLGEATSTAPSGASDVVRIIGYARTPDIIFFSPSNDWITF